MSKHNKQQDKIKVINGITFYCDSAVRIDNIIDELEDFSRVCDDNAYSVYIDESAGLVIY